MAAGRVCSWHVPCVLPRNKSGVRLITILLRAGSLGRRTSRTAPVRPYSCRHGTSMRWAQTAGLRGAANCRICGRPRELPRKGKERKERKEEGLTTTAARCGASWRSFASAAVQNLLRMTPETRAARSRSRNRPGVVTLHACHTARTAACERKRCAARFMPRRAPPEATASLSHARADLCASSTPDGAQRCIKRACAGCAHGRYGLRPLLQAPCRTCACLPRPPGSRAAHLLPMAGASWLSIYCSCLRRTSGRKTADPARAVDERNLGGAPKIMARRRALVSTHFAPRCQRARAQHAVYVFKTRGFAT